MLTPYGSITEKDQVTIQIILLDKNDKPLGTPQAITWEQEVWSLKVDHSLIYYHDVNSKLLITNQSGVKQTLSDYTLKIEINGKEHDGVMVLRTIDNTDVTHDIGLEHITLSQDGTETTPIALGSVLGFDGIYSRPFATEEISFDISNIGSTVPQDEIILTLTLVHNPTRKAYTPCTVKWKNGEIEMVHTLINKDLMVTITNNTGKEIDLHRDYTLQVTVAGKGTNDQVTCNGKHVASGNSTAGPPIVHPLGPGGWNILNGNQIPSEASINIPFAITNGSSSNPGDKITIAIELQKNSKKVDAAVINVDWICS